MRRLRFVLREGIRALSRAGLAGGLAILSMTVLAAYGAGTLAARDALVQARESLLARFEMEAFLLPGREEQLDDVAAWLAGREGVVEVQRVDKQLARERFAEQYGEELFDLLEENPLPVSVIVRYDPARVETAWIEREAEFVAAHEDIEDVAFEGELLQQVESLGGRVSLWLIGVAVLIAAVAMFFTVQSVRVAAQSSLSWAHAVLLVGGTIGQVRQPFIAAGMLAGLIGGALGAGAVAGVQLFLAAQGVTPDPRPWAIAGAVLLSMIVGGIGANAAIRRRSWRGKLA